MFFWKKTSFLHQRWPSRAWKIELYGALFQLPILPGSVPIFGILQGFKWVPTLSKKQWWWFQLLFNDVGFNCFFFSPRSLGKWSNLTTNLGFGVFLWTFPEKKKQCSVERCIRYQVWLKSSFSRSFQMDVDSEKSVQSTQNRSKTSTKIK